MIITQINLRQRGLQHPGHGLRRKLEAAKMKGPQIQPIPLALETGGNFNLVSRIQGSVSLSKEAKTRDTQPKNP